MELLGVVCDGSDGKIINFSINEQEWFVEKIHFLQELASVSLSFEREIMEEFWSNYFDHDDWKDKSWKMNISKRINTPNNDSISLSAFMSPLLLLYEIEKWQSSYTHICMTGIVDKDANVGCIQQIDDKFSIFCKYVDENSNPNDTFAFVYVSNKQYELKHSRINVLHIFPGMNVSYVKNILATGLILNKSNSEEFHSAISQQMKKNIDDKGECYCEMYISGNDNSKAFHDMRIFELFKYAVDMAYPFSLTIYMSKYKTNSEITSDFESKDIPQWGQKISTEKYHYYNEQLKILAQSINDQIYAFKNYVFFSHAYEPDSPNFRKFGRLKIIQKDLSDSKEICLYGDKTTENSLFLNNNLVAYSEGDVFCFTDNAEKVKDKLSSFQNIFCKKIENDDKNKDDESNTAAKHTVAKDNKDKREKSVQFVTKIVDLLNKLEKDFAPDTLHEIKNICDSEELNLPKFNLYGFPGTGKSTQIKRLAEFFGKRILSSEELINHYVFDDLRKNPHNPNAEEPDPNDISEYVVYDRKSFEENKNNIVSSDKNKEMMSYIRECAVEITLRQAEVTGDLIDLGGKEQLVEHTRFLLNEFNYISIFLCPAAKDILEKPITYPWKKNNPIKDEEQLRFETYADYYKNNPDLFNEDLRKNICAMAEGKGYSEKFKNTLEKEMWKPRFRLYNQKYDARVIRSDPTIDNQKYDTNVKMDDKYVEIAEKETTVNILKAVFTVYKKRLENELRLMG